MFLVSGLKPCTVPSKLDRFVLRCDTNSYLFIVFTDSGGAYDTAPSELAKF